MHVPAGANQDHEDHEDHEGSGQASCQDQEPGMGFHGLSCTLSWIYTVVCFFSFDCIFTLFLCRHSQDHEAAKDWVRYGVLWNDPMMSSVVVVLLVICHSAWQVWPPGQWLAVKCQKCQSSWAWLWKVWANKACSHCGTSWSQSIPKGVHWRQ